MYMKCIRVNVRFSGSYPKNSIVGDSKDTKKSTVPVSRKRDVGPVVTCCNPLPRAINQAEHRAQVYKE